MKRLPQMQRMFCIKYFELGNATKAAIEAGYSPRTAKQQGYNLLSKPRVQARLEELRAKVEDKAIADVAERKRILTEIARGNLMDYQEVGADGGYLNIGKESPNTRAISEITTTTKDDNTLVSKVKLHNPTQAIDLLNKMDKVYSDAGGNEYVINIEQAVIDAGNILTDKINRLATKARERELPQSTEQ